MSESFPLRKAMTRGFRLGAPRTVAVAPDGDRVLFLRSDGPTDPINHLWLATSTSTGWAETRLVDAGALLSGVGEDLPPEERARRERLREVSGGVTAYSVATDWSLVSFVLSGRLYAVAPEPGAPVVPLPTTAPCGNATTAPDGTRVAVTVGRDVEVIDVATAAGRSLLTSDDPLVSWGSAEFIAAEEMGRFAGMWWAPDSRHLLVARVDEHDVEQWWIGDPAEPARAAQPIRYPAAGTANARVSLWVADLDGQRWEIPWDHAALPYLARVRWDDHGVLVAVQDRSQQRVQVLHLADPRPDTPPGIIADEQESPWAELLPGVPRLTAHGLVLARVDPDTDTRRLVVVDSAGRPVADTPPRLQVHAVAAADEGGIVFTGSEGDPSTSDLWLLTPAGETKRVSQPGGWSGGTAAGGTVVTARADLASPATTLTVARDADVWVIPSHAEAPALTIRPEFLTDESGWSRIAVLWPGGVPAREPLPVVLSPYGGPHAQRSVRAAGAFATEQWLADQGFCVVVADGPGAPSRPTNEFAIAGDLAGPPLAGQIEALERVAAAFPGGLDTDRVGIRGWSFGGYLAALAVLERPDIFHAAVAGAPVTDWQLYDTHYTERYLGLPQDDEAAYAGSSLLPRAARATTHRPLLLVHGLADDNVVAAHTLRLSSALLAAGYPHSVLPLSGVTHMTPQEVVTENLLRGEARFLAESLA